jgi:hypothetical protein
VNVKGKIVLSMLNKLDKGSINISQGGQRCHNIV